MSAAILTPEKCAEYQKAMAGAYHSAIDEYAPKEEMEEVFATIAALRESNAALLEVLREVVSTDQHADECEFYRPHIIEIDPLRPPCDCYLVRARAAIAAAEGR